MRCAIVLVAATPLIGCAAAGPALTSLTTASVAGTVGSATGSAVAGIGAGFAAAYGVDQAVKYGERTLQDTAAPLDNGQSASWTIPSDGVIQKAAQLTLSGDQGTVEVARTFGQVIPCKDVIFTVKGDHGVYTTTICKNDQGAWMWAEGEPSIHRWGYLQ
jgi:hypothetical protein